MDGTGQLILWWGLDGKGQLWDRPSLLMPIGFLNIVSLGGRWTEKDNCSYVGGWTEQVNFGTDLHFQGQSDALTSGVWAASGQKRAIVSTSGVRVDGKG